MLGFAFWIAAALAAEPLPLQFDNGLRVVVLDTPSASSALAVTWVDAGWREDAGEVKGITHLLEHVWFRSDADPDGSDLWTELTERGCRVDAHTGPEFMRYVSQCPATELPWLIGQELRRIERPLEGVTDDEIALERAIVGHENRERSDEGGRLVQQIYQQLLPAEDPVHSRLAQLHELAGHPGLEALQDRASTAFAAQRLTLVISGPLDVEAVRSQLEEAFGPGRPLLARPEAPVPSGALVPPPVTAESQQIALRFALPRLVLAWNVHPALGDSSSLGVIADELGGSMLWALREDAAIQSVSCEVVDENERPVLLCQFILSDVVVRPDVEAAARRGLAEGLRGDGLRRLRSGVAQRRTQVPQELARTLGDPRSNAMRIASEVGRTGQLRSAEEVVDGFRKWRPGPVLQAAGDWFTWEHAAKLWVMPGTQAAELAPAAEAPQRVAREPIAASSEAMLPADRPAAVRRLASGLTMVAVQHADVALVTASVRVPGGLGQQPHPLVVVAENFSAAPGARETREISVGSAVHRDSGEVWAVGPANRLRQTLNTSLAMAALRVPTFGDEERLGLERWVDGAQLHARASGKLPEVLAERLLWANATPGHLPSAEIGAEDFAALRKVSPMSVMAHLVQRYVPSGAVLVVSGPQSPEELLDAAERVYSAWKMPEGVAAAGPLVTAPAGAPTPARFHLVDPSLSSSTLRYRCSLPTPRSQAHLEVLGAAFEDQLWRAVREAEGLSYTPWAFVGHWPDGTTTVDWGVNTSPGQVARVHGVVEGSLFELIAVIDDRAAVYGDRLARELHGAASSVAGTEALVFRAALEGGDPTRPVAHAIGQLEAVDPGELARDVKSCVGRTTRVVYGPTDPEMPGSEKVWVVPLGDGEGP